MNFNYILSLPERYLSKFFRSEKKCSDDIIEGSVKIKRINDNLVFYNNVQKRNRDLSILIIKIYMSYVLELESMSKKNIYYTKSSFFKKEEFKKVLMDLYNFKSKKLNEGRPFVLVEPLAASGIRSIRYCKEISGLSGIIANDIDLNSFNTMKNNVKYNNLENENIFLTNIDANFLLYSIKNKSSTDFIDIIDLDPYGSSVPFLDSSIRSIAHNGLLCVTFTDMRVLSGLNNSKCISKYGSSSCKCAVSHELAIRIALNHISSVASKYNKAIMPLACFSIDFYIRCFILIKNSRLESILASANQSYVKYCNRCCGFDLFKFHKIDGDNIHTRLPNSLNSSCDNCESDSVSLVGPIWNKNYASTDFLSYSINFSDINGINKSSDAFKLIEGLSYEVMDDEESILGYDISKISSMLKLTIPKHEILFNAFESNGFKISKTHYNNKVIKVNSSSRKFFEILRELFRYLKLDNNNLDLKNFSKLKLSEDSQVSLNHNDLFNFESNRKKQRYLVNPEKNWGPKRKSKPKNDK